MDVIDSVDNAHAKHSWITGGFNNSDLEIVFRFALGALFTSICILLESGPLWL